MGSSSNLNDLVRFTVAVKAGELIFREQDQSREMFIICRGQVKLTRQYAGEERLLETLGVGDFFGEMSLLEELPREVSAQAVSDCELFRIDASTFEALVQEAPDIPIRMLRKLSRRLREHQEHDARAAAIAMAPFQPRSAEQKPTDTPQVEDAPSSSSVSPPPAGSDAPAAQAGASDEGAHAAWLVDVRSAARFELPAGAVEAVVGRSDRASGHVPDIDIGTLDRERTVGRRHAIVAVRDGAYFLRDQKARNGTFVNDVRLSPDIDTPIAAGDRLRFGLVETVFEIGPRQAAP